MVSVIPGKGRMADAVIDAGQVSANCRRRGIGDIKSRFGRSGVSSGSSGRHLLLSVVKRDRHQMGRAIIDALLARCGRYRHVIPYRHAERRPASAGEFISLASASAILEASSRYNRHLQAPALISAVWRKGISSSEKPSLTCSSSLRGAMLTFSCVIFTPSGGAEGKR